jgi:hypothetical protein
MSIYRCSYCDQYRDSDIHGHEEHPENSELEYCDLCFPSVLSDEEELEMFGTQNKKK